MALDIADVCENCGAEMGKLEKMYIWQTHVVCFACYAKLDAESVSQIKSPEMTGDIKSLGLTRGQCWIVFILGLLFSPAIIGIPLMIWGGLAEYNIAKEKTLRKG